MVPKIQIKHFAARTTNWILIFSLTYLIPLEATCFQDIEETGVKSEWLVQSGVQVNIGKKYTTNLRGFVSIGKTVEISNGFQADVSAAINLYTGGIGTDQGVRHKWQPVADLNIAGGLTAGFGDAKVMTMNIFHNFSGNTINSTHDGSLSIGLVQTFSTLGWRYRGRNQTNGYIYLRGWPATLGLYNDLFARAIPFLRQNDSYWTGGGEFQVDADFGIFSFVYDGFTGKRPTAMDTVELKGHRYHNQPIREQRFNNGITSLRFSTPDYVVGINHVGNGKILNGQWFQNWIHDKTKSPRFYNTSVESLQLTFSGTWSQYLDN
jgi:hypothetical protein